MAKRNACKRCKAIFEGGECPVCKGTNQSGNWQGRIIVIDPEKSDIAKVMGLNEKREYAIKVR